jgi:hypothetical protein
VQESAGKDLEKELTMAEIGHIHWTEDEELLGRFVLGRVPERESRALKEHLETCPSCMDNVQRERILASGAKRLGRHEMKERLAERIGRSRRRTIRYEIMGAAAVILLAVGLAVYQRWIPTGGETVATQAIKSSDADHLKPSPMIAEQSDAEKTYQKKTPVPAERLRAGRKEAEEKTDGFLGDGRVQRDESQPTAGAGRVDQAVVSSTAPASVANAASEMWLEGVQLFNESRELASREMNQASKQMAKSKVLAEEAVAKDERIAPNGVVQAPRVEIQQRQWRDLPTMQQKLSAEEKTIQTKVDRVDGQMRLTLYLDPPASEEEIRQSQVRQIGSDSLVVIVGKQQIGYKLPAGWGK